MKVMKKLVVLFILLFLISCEKEPDSFWENVHSYGDYHLTIGSDLEYDGEVYIFNYPEGNSDSYFKINFNSSPYQRVYWESPDEYITVMWSDTTWTPVVNYSTYADDNGEGHQMVYVNPTLIVDTLNIIGVIADLFYNPLLQEEILIKIQ